MPSIFSFKIVEKVLIPVNGTHVDAAVFLTFLFLHLAAAGLLLFSVKRPLVFRRMIQVLSAVLFLLFFHQCLCIMRDWAYGFQQVGRDNTAAFGNLFMPVILVVSAFLMGRIFCGFICPMGFLMEIFSGLCRWKERKIYSFCSARAAKSSASTAAAADPAADSEAESLVSALARAEKVIKKVNIVLIILLGLLSYAISSYIWPDNRGFYESTALIWIFLLLFFLAYSVLRPQSLRAHVWSLNFSLYLWVPLVLAGVYVNNPWCSIYASNLEYASMAAFVISLLSAAVYEMSWCRFVCPLGAVLRLCSEYSFFKRKARDDEKKAWKICPTGALDPMHNRGFKASSCFYCCRCLKKDSSFEIEKGRDE
jgi:polyferredoxin